MHIRIEGSARGLAVLIVAILAPFAASATPVTDVGYGSLQSDFRKADVVVSAQVTAGDPSCSANTQWNRATQGAECQAFIRIDRVYKGSVTPGDAISVNYQKYAFYDPRFRHVVAGQYALFVLCQSGSGFVYCPNSMGRAYVRKPVISASANDQTGLQELALDLMSDLKSGDGNDTARAARLLWALGDVVNDHLSEIQNAAMSSPLQTKIPLEAILIMASSATCGADLSAIANLSSPFTGFDMISISSALEKAGARCLSQAKFLVKSPTPSLRLAGIKIVVNARDSSSVPLLASLLHDSEPGIAFNAMQALTMVTGIQFADEPSFNEFVKNPEPYTREWTNWWQSQSQ